MRGSRASALEKWISTPGCGTMGAATGRSQASTNSSGSVAPPSMAQPAAQQCGKAPLCCWASWAGPWTSRVTTRGPLAVQIMVVAPALPGGKPDAARAEDAISA
jgi:hypothetical protein